MVYSETFFPVRYYETDQMGIVHHSNYIRYFECARNNMMREFGYPIEKCEEDGVTIPIVSLRCNYRHPAMMGDDLKVTASIETVPMAKLFIKQAVFNSEGTLCAEGEVVLGFLSKATGHPTRCPEPLVKAIEAHMGDR
ncbi:MAG: acyl-CoA thioesterase [Bacteroidales bacterium]|nr:acyl-CoA thioesterase [Bacteroidales bacterium]